MILKLISINGEPIKIDTDYIVSLTLWNNEWTKIEWFKNGKLMTKVVRESPQQIFRLIKNQTDIQEKLEHDKVMQEFIRRMRDSCGWIMK